MRLIKKYQNTPGPIIRADNIRVVSPYYIPFLDELKELHVGQIPVKDRSGNIVWISAPKEATISTPNNPTVPKVRLQITNRQVALDKESKRLQLLQLNLATHGIAPLEFLSRFTPTLLIGGITRNLNGWDYMQHGNNGIVTDNFAREWPLLAGITNFAGDLAIPVGVSKAAPYVGKVGNFVIGNPTRFGNNTYKLKWVPVLGEASKGTAYLSSNLLKVPTILNIPEGYLPIDGWEFVRPVTLNGKGPKGNETVLTFMMRNLHPENGGAKFKSHYDLLLEISNGKYSKLVSNDAIKEYNVSLLLNRPDFVRELLEVAAQMDKGLLKEPTIESEYHNFPEIWKVALNTKSGRLLFPNGMRIIGKGEWPGVPEVVSSPAYADGIFTGYLPSLTFPYMRPGRKVGGTFEARNAAIEPMTSEDYIKLVGPEKGAELGEIDARMEKLLNIKDFYTQAPILNELEKLNYRKKLLLGLLHHNYGGTDLFAVPIDENGNILNIFSPKITYEGMEADPITGELRLKFFGEPVDPSLRSSNGTPTAESLTSPDDYAHSLTLYNSDDAVGAFLPKMSDIGYGDEVVFRTGYPLRSLFGSNFNFETFDRWGLGRYKAGGNIKKRIKLNR